MKKKILAFVLACLILLFAFILGFVMINFIMNKVVGKKNIIETPKLVEVHKDVARKRCKEMGLYTQIVKEEYNDEIEKNYIISQDPIPEKRIKKNRTIEVVVSKGPKLVRVPFLETLTKRQASLRLKNIGLKEGKINYRYSDNVKKGQVIYTEPPAEEQVPLRSEIELFISLGKIPDNSGQIDIYKQMYNED